MKDTICLIAGIVGGFIATLLGGWDSALATLACSTSITPTDSICHLFLWRAKLSV